MPWRSRLGFTLVELLVALVIFVLVGGSLYRVLNVSQRAARTQTEKASMQGGLRTGLQLAVAEIQEIWTDEEEPASGITAMTATQLSYEAMRGFGLTCADPVPTAITVRKRDYSGLSVPTAGQGIYVFAENNDATQDDDEWRDVVINDVTTGTCADGITEAWVLTVAGLDADDTEVFWPGPVRTHESMVLGLVAADGRNWLGIGTGGVLTPLAGPLTTIGLSFTYKDDSNNNTGTPAEVKSIILKLYGELDRAANQGLFGNVTTLRDSMTVRVQLRNGR